MGVETLQFMSSLVIDSWCGEGAGEGLCTL
jgi:hypothetical protein